MTEDEYKGSARFYDLFTAVFLDPFRREVRRLVERERPASVLDVCCGTGRQLSLLHGLGAGLTGLDLSQAMIGRARDQVKGSACLCLADATGIPFPDRTFDMASISFALHEKAPGVRRAILAETVRVLSDNGLLAVVDYTVPRKTSDRALFLAVQMVEWIAGREHFYNFRDYHGRGGTEALLARAGLEYELIYHGLGTGAGVFLVRTGARRS